MIINSKVIKNPKISKINKNVSFLLIGIFAVSILSQISILNVMENFNNSQNNANILPNYAQDVRSANEGIVYKDKANSLGEIEATYGTFDIVNNASSYIYDPVGISYTRAYNAMKFSKTVTPASLERATGVGSNKQSYVTIRINETILWSYSSAATEFTVGFSPYLQPAVLHQMYLNGTLLSENDYEISEGDSSNTYIYDFESLYTENTNNNFIIKYVYDWNITISKWGVDSPYYTNEDNEDLGNLRYLNDTLEDLTQKYEYNTTFGKFASTYTPLNISILFKITLPNNEDIYDVVLDYYSDDAFELDNDVYFEISDKNEIQFNSYCNLRELQSIGIKFKADFTVEILDTVDGFWCADRLVDGMNFRERDYKITVVDGPADLWLKYFGFNDTSIYFDQLSKDNDKVTSLTGKYTSVVNMNTSDPDLMAGGNYTDEVFTDGISLLAASQLSPYVMFVGELDIVTVKYYAERTLTFKVTDNIKTPLSNIEVNVYFGNKLYGTKITNSEVYPMAPKITNSYGVVSIPFVPVGNYTIEILDSQGNSVENHTVNSLNDLADNMVITSYYHFPSTIIYFGGLSSLFIIVGIFIFKKEQK